MAIARANGGTGRDVSNSTWTLTFGFTATAGNLLVIVATSSPNVMTTPSGYTLAVSKTTVPNTYIWYKVAAGGETSAGMSVTGGSSYSIAHVIEFSGTASSSPLDKTASGGGSSDSTAQSGTTAALAQADEVVVVGYGLDDQVFSFTQASGFTSNALTRDNFDARTLQSSYKIVSATTAVTADGTWPMSAVDANVLATFKAAGSSGVTGTAAATFGSFTASASGAHGVAGSAAGTSPSFTGSGTATHGVSGAAVATFGAFTGSATGTHGTTGTATAAWAGFSATATGAHGVTGEAAGEWSPFEASATGSFGADVTGTAEASWPAFTATATGTVCVTGDAVAAWAAFTGSASGAHGVAGTATATMPQFTATASGRLPPPWRPKVVFVT